MKENINFIEIDPQADKQHLIDKFEQETGTKLYPAQDAMILINLIAYYANLVKTQMNDAANLNLVKHSRAPFLDFIGENKKCERLENEVDDNYADRILTAPEGYSVAGPEAAYIYYAKSAHADIVDVKVDVPDEAPSVKIGETTEFFDESVIENDTFSAECDFQNEEITVTLNEALSIGDTIKVKIPHPYKLKLYILTKDGESTEDVLNAVREKLNGVRPISDYVEVLPAVIQNFRINATVYLKSDAPENETKELVNEALNEFLKGFKNTLNKSVRKNKIRTEVCKIDKVYDIKLTLPTSNLEAKKDTCYVGEIGTITFERVTDE